MIMCLTAYLSVYLTEQVTGTVYLSVKTNQKPNKTNTYMNQQIEKLWDLIVNYELATEQSLQLVTRLNGYTLETMEDVLYALTGYHSYEQFMENER